MVLLIWLVLFLLIVSLFVVAAGFLRHAILDRYSGARPVTCPENHQPAVVALDGSHAVATLVDGSPALRISGCTRWPEHSACNQACLAEAHLAEPYPEAAPIGPKQINHLPVLLAAFAAWYIGMIWHSHYLFRDAWTEAFGLTPSQVKDIVRWMPPQLLSAAVCLLFAYGVAWLLALLHRKGVLEGVLTSTALAAAVLIATCFGIVRLPPGLLAIEAGYVLLATFITGAIVGGLWDKLVVRGH
ncbi:DUF1761 domain-containing protein [Occallatibacter savannae]|uniref:DUF1761 domain-containing protein n=1 Tax=Occallatibacter savannae TaxID=1002691 RepID=UPI000D68D6C9|nr:DUF1761 domain-containing protein [Occallatibacter savannae]